MSADRQSQESCAAQRLTLRMGADGLPRDDVPHFSADRAHLHSFTQASEALSRFRAPVLFDRADPHSYLIVALMDGTGNDADQDPVHATNVARFRYQVALLRRSGVDRVYAEYTPGPGTQANPLERTLDGALGRTSLARAEGTYASVLERAQGIFAADPDARVSLHLEGFSRGASQVPLLARIIEQRGIPDKLSATSVVDADGELRTVYARYHQPPGQTLMSVGLYDPVPTGYMELMDRRLPPSVVSGFQISAVHERRGLFPVDQILPQGASADGRFLHVSVAGAHSDIGGSYLRNGLGARSLNLMTDYHNSLFDAPLLPRVHEPLDPRMNVIHYSEHGNLLFRVAPKVERIALAGQVHQLSPDLSRIGAGGVVHEPAQAPEPMRAALEQQIRTRQPVTRPAEAATASIQEGDDLLQRLRNSGVELRPYQAPMLERPGVRVAGAAAAMGVVGSLHEAANTAQRVGLLYGLNNPDAARSELQQFAAHGLGGWSGGAAAGAAIGSGTGPGVLAFMAYGAVIGGTVGGKLAERWDQHQIFNQTDREGVAWSFNGSQWLREELGDLSGSTATDGETGSTASNARLQSFSALPDKASELNYRASRKAAALALGDVPTPLDPFRLPASAADRPSLRPADWEQDPQTRQWSRQVAAGYQEKGVPYYEQELASAQRSRELDLQSQRRIEDNVAHSRAAIAARYELVHASQQWQRHGDPPAAVNAALNADTLVGSDGRLYQRSDAGAWLEGGRHAGGNLRRELDATHAVLEPALVEHREQVARITAAPAPVLTPRQQQRMELAALYRQHGVQPFPENLEAAMDAVERTQAAQGIAAGTTSLMLEPRWDGTWDVDSSIAHLQRIDGVVMKVAVTGPEALQQARQARSDPGVLDAAALGLPEQASPWHGRVDRRESIAPSTLEPSTREDVALSIPPAQRQPQADAGQATLPSREVRSEAATPMQRGHPDHALYQQIRKGISDLDAQHGRSYDATSERMTASLLLLARRNGLTRVDQVVLSSATQDAPAGERLFLVQGQTDDPAHLRAVMATAEAAQAPVEESLQELDVVSRENLQRRQAEQQQQQEDDLRVQHDMQIIAASGGM